MTKFNHKVCELANEEAYMIALQSLNCHEGRISCLFIGPTFLAGNYKYIRRCLQGTCGVMSE